MADGEVFAKNEYNGSIRINLVCRLDDQCETHLFRIAQEALTNVARHSARYRRRCPVARTRMLLLSSLLRIMVAGYPSDQQSVRSSLGMVGMRARAREAGGRIDRHQLRSQVVCGSRSRSTDKANLCSLHKKTRILLADDHSVVRSGFRALWLRSRTWM